ncbi:hypothetical protein [Nocardiopsis sp. CA-288880]|uniref:hypothetical protein n=1 Tax=Nocardiopsis sp. CA-288880 TaxID=3239995 RepID=UPI003D97F28B
MNNRILGLFKDGPERGGAHRASGPAPPRPSFDEEFRGVRVCLIGNRIYFDWGDGEQTALNMERCDQLMLGDSSRETPRRLTLRFRLDRPLHDRDDPADDMVLIKVGLRDSSDRRLAKELYEHLVGRFARLRPPAEPDGHDLPGAAGPTEEPVPEPEEAGWHPGDAAPIGRRAEPPHPMARLQFGEDGPQHRPPPADFLVLDEDRAPARGRRHRHSGHPGRTGPGGPDAAKEWAGFVPGLRTRELHEEFFRRAGGADPR